MSDPNVQNVTVSRVVRKQSLYASVIRSCKKCGAPGYWHDTPGVNVGCYAPEKVTQLGADPVGAVCPQCGASRQEVERKGEIWRREFRVSLWSVLREMLSNLYPKWRKL
jgi:hypothetical protein